MRLDRRALARLSFVAVTLASAVAGAQAMTPPSESSPPAVPADGAAANAPAPPPTPAARPDEDDVLRRLLRSGCRDGLAEARELAERGTATWAATVTRLCGEILAARAHPPPAPPPAVRRERDGRGT